MQLADHKLAKSIPKGKYFPYGEFDTGHLSGSCITTDAAGVLEVTDLLGQVTTIFLFLPRALIVSQQLPSGCAVFNSNAMIYSALRCIALTLTHEWLPRDLFPNIKAGLFLQRAVVPVSGLKEWNALLTNDRPPRTVFPYQDIIRQIQDTFALHTTDLADLLRVSRQTVHSWKSDNGSEPSAASVKKLLALRDANQAWRAEFHDSAPAWLVNSPVQGKTLKAWLMLVVEEKLGMAEVTAVVKKSLSPKSPRGNQSKRLSRREPTAFEDFVDSLGDPSPTEEE